jgi:hypothetical protein
MSRTHCLMALVGTLALIFCESQIVDAQALPPSNQTYGMFGNRALGQPLVPGHSTFGGGIQTGPSGNFLGSHHP